MFLCEKSDSFKRYTSQVAQSREVEKVKTCHDECWGQPKVVVPLYEIIAGERKVIMKMSSDALRWLFTLSSKVSINRRTRGGG